MEPSADTRVRRQSFRCRVPDVNSYRLYFLDYAGHIHEARSFQCPDDAAAQQAAQAQHDRRSMELWRGDHLVRAYPHAADADTAA
jgi:hypothetical protein